MEDLSSLKEYVGRYQCLLSEMESEKLPSREKISEVIAIEILFEDSIYNDLFIFPEVNQKEIENKELQGEFNKLMEDIFSGMSEDDIYDKYPSEIVEYSKVQISESMGRNKLYIKYLELQSKRWEMDSKMGYIVHRVRCKVDEKYRQYTDLIGSKYLLEKEAQKVYETKPDEMYG